MIGPSEDAELGKDFFTGDILKGNTLGLNYKDNKQTPKITCPIGTEVLYKRGLIKKSEFNWPQATETLNALIKANILKNCSSTEVCINEDVVGDEELIKNTAKNHFMNVEILLQIGRTRHSVVFDNKYIRGEILLRAVANCQAKDYMPGLSKAILSKYGPSIERHIEITFKVMPKFLYRWSPETEKQTNWFKELSSFYKTNFNLENIYASSK